MPKLLMLMLLLSTAATAQQPQPCQSEAHRQFDFWVGKWNVYSNDRHAGVNLIRKVHGGCVLHEDYTTVTGGYSGYSLNIYDVPRAVWHQTWTDSSGLLLQLEGTFVDGSMTLEGELPGADGSTVKQQIRWTPNEDGTVRQLWRTSSDGGVTWQVAFDGLYRKVE